MLIKKLYSFLVIYCLVFVSVFSTSLAVAEKTQILNNGNNKLLAYVIGNQLPAIHFSSKTVNNDLAQSVFDLYLKQLDYQKRFLLENDVIKLKTMSGYIDDNLLRGKVLLPKAGYAILTARLTEVEKMVEEISSLSIEPNIDEYYETDAEKLNYSQDIDELHERWRKIIKMQIISKFLDILEEKKKETSREAAWADATAKIKKKNKRFFKRLKQETEQDHYDRFFKAVSRAFDPHTDYMPPANKEDFDIHMRGSLEGIGALLREEDGLIKVVRVIPGSASFRQGRLKAEDIILQVADKDGEPVEISNMRLRDAVRLIRGPKGTIVRLTVKKADGVQEVIAITRDIVQLEETFVKNMVLSMGDGKKIGYILIPSFYRDFAKSNNEKSARNSADDTRKAVLTLRESAKLSGLILDLRDNGGGSLSDAVDIAGLFIESGPIVQIKNSNGVKRVLNDEDPEILYDGPLVVLVNKFSASASEIVAAALQDYQRAVIVGGENTHGKGTVQTIISINDHIPFVHLRGRGDLGALKVTIQKFYRVNGGSTQYKGVASDIILPSLFDHLDSGEQQLDNSLAWDSMEAVPFAKLANTPFNIGNLKDKSNERVSANEDFIDIVNEALLAKDRKNETNISLNINDIKTMRKSLKESEEKISGHFNRDIDKQEDDSNRPHAWKEKTQKDPYVLEAMNIIEDMI